MDNSMNQPELETFDYRAPTTEVLGKESYKSHHFEQPASASPEVKRTSNTVIRPETRVNKIDNAGQPTEQPKCKTCNGTHKVRPCTPKGKLFGAFAPDIPCPDCPEQPNTNAMTIVSIDGAIDVALNLLDQLRPKTEQVVECITDLESWKDKNFKHLRKAFE